MSARDADTMQTECVQYLRDEKLWKKDILHEIIVRWCDYSSLPVNQHPKVDLSLATWRNAATKPNLVDQIVKQLQTKKLC